MRFSQNSFYSAIHGTLSVLNHMMQDPVESRKTVLIKYLSLFQKETDVDLFVLNFDDVGMKLCEADDAMMRKTPAYRLTGNDLIKFIEFLILKVNKEQFE